MKTRIRMALAGACAIAGALVVRGLHIGTHAVAPTSTSGTAARFNLRFTPEATPQSVLWVLAVGVSRYPNAALNLRFADADAVAIAAAFERQRGGPVYSDVKTLVLTNDAVTRESILAGMDDFLNGATAADVVVIYLAGHGVRDRNVGTYYYLPSSATPETMRTAGLRVSDIDEMLRIVRANVRNVVLLVDTCRAGALRTATSSISSDEVGAHIKGGDGFYLFAAARPGEESRESSKLGHGVFTQAILEALQGAADANHDGLLPISELSGYVAARVAALTDDLQHPYQKLEGIDALLAAVRPGEINVSDGVAAKRSPLALTPRTSNTIGVVEFRNLGTAADANWITQAIRFSVTTELSKVRALRVQIPEISEGLQLSPVDRLAEARDRGLQRIVTGTYQTVGDQIHIEAEIVDTGSGAVEATARIDGNLADFFSLQKTLALQLLQTLPVKFSPEDDARIRDDRSTDVDAFRLLLKSEDLLPQGALAAPNGATPAPDGPLSQLPRALRWLATSLSSVAYAEPPPAQIAGEVHSVLEALRRALQHKDELQLAALYVELSDEHASVLREYFANTGDLSVEFSDVVMEKKGEAVLVQYTRIDQFVDRRSGKPVRLEVRLARRFTRENGQWKIASAQ